MPPRAAHVSLHSAPSCHLIPKIPRAQAGIGPWRAPALATKCRTSTNKRRSSNGRTTCASIRASLDDFIFLENGEAIRMPVKRTTPELWPSFEFGREEALHRQLQASGVPSTETRSGWSKAKMCLQPQQCVSMLCMLLFIWAVHFVGC